MPTGPEDLRRWWFNGTVHTEMPEGFRIGINYTSLLFDPNSITDMNNVVSIWQTTALGNQRYYPLQSVNYEYLHCEIADTVVFYRMLRDGTFITESALVTNIDMQNRQIHLSNNMNVHPYFIKKNVTRNRNQHRNELGDPTITMTDQYGLNDLFRETYTDVLQGIHEDAVIFGEGAARISDTGVVTAVDPTSGTINIDYEAAQGTYTTPWGVSPLTTNANGAITFTSGSTATISGGLSLGSGGSGSVLMSGTNPANVTWTLTGNEHLTYSKRKQLEYKSPFSQWEESLKNNNG